MKKSLPDKEWTTVVSCCREICGNRQAGLPVIEKNTDWQRVVSIAGKHGLINFVYLRLAENCRELIPEEILSQLKTLYLLNSRRNTYLGACLIRILSLFEQNDIMAIPFKGPVQSEMIYQDIGIRSFSDLDILVKKEEAVRARNLLMALGFKTGVTIPESQMEDYLEKENFFQLVDASRALNIDLHWEMSGRYNLAPIYYPAEETLIPAQLLGKEIRTLNHEDMLIHLCIHGASHCWDRLELICSVAKIASSGFIDNWEQVVGKAETLKCKRMVLLGLLLAGNCFDTPLAPAIRAAIEKDSRLETLSDYILGKINNGDVSFSESLGWRFSPVHFHLRDSLGDGVKYFLRLFFRPTIREWDKYPLPDSLLFL